MLAKVFSSAVLGIDAYIVDVEVDIAFGLPSFSTVGLPDLAVKESRDRVKAAIKNARPSRTGRGRSATAQAGSGPPNRFASFPRRRPPGRSALRPVPLYILRSGHLYAASLGRPLSW